MTATVPLGDVIQAAGARAGVETDLPVYSVTKHAGFVPSLEYFKKRVFSRDVADYKLVEQGHFAYATIHLDEGSIGIAPERALISPMYTVFSVDESRVVPDYLIRYLKSPRALGHYPRLGKGAVHRRKAISLTALGSLPLPLPTLEEQRRVAAILDKADALRAKRCQVLAHLDALVQSTFHAMFGDLEASCSAEGQLEDVLVDGLSNGLSPSATGDVEAEVLTLSAVTGGTYDPSVAKTARFAKAPTGKQVVREDSFLISRGNGNPDLVGIGVVAQPDPERPIMFPDTVIGGQIDKSRIEPSYLASVFATDAVRRQVRASVRTTNGTYKVNQQGLGAVKFPLPPINRQHEFAVRVEAINTQRSVVERALATDNELFGSLQSRAFRG